MVSVARAHIALSCISTSRASIISGPKIHFLAADRPIVVINPSLADNIAARASEGREEERGNWGRASTAEVRGSFWERRQLWQKKSDGGAERGVAMVC